VAHLEDFFESTSSNWIVIGLHLGHGSKRAISQCELKGLIIPGGIQILLDLVRLFDLLDDSEDVVEAFNGSLSRIGPKFVTQSQANKLCHDFLIREVSMR
jgi:hypothetical protein